MTVETNTRPIIEQMRNVSERRSLLNPFTHITLAALTGVLAVRTVRERFRKTEEVSRNNNQTGEIAVSRLVELVDEPAGTLNVVPKVTFSHTGTVFVEKALEQVTTHATPEE